MSVLAATAQMPGVAKSKTLVGNVAGNTTTTTTRATAKTTTTIITARTTSVTTKLSNHDEHNEYVAANAVGKHLRHAMLGNCNQQNEQRHARLEKGSGNSSKNNNGASSCCGCVGTQQLKQQQQLLSLNKEMNDVNCMQATTTTAAIMNDVTKCKRILSNNNSCCRADSYIKWNYERCALESDNEKAPLTHSPMPTVRCHTPVATVCATPTLDALSVAEISTRTSRLPTAVGSRQAETTKATTHTIARQMRLPLTATILTAEPGLKSASGSEISNSFCAASGALAGVGRVTQPIIANKRRRLSARGGKWRRKHCKRKRRCHMQANSVRAEMESEMAKTNVAVKTSAIRSTTKRQTTLNSGILTSFLVKVTLLALCNATAATALSALAATLGETINSSVGPPPANGVWKAYESVENVENVSATNGNSSHGDSQIAAANGGTSDISFNDSDNLLEEDDREYIFDRTDVRIIFITLYTLVFCCCFFGNLLVILVVTLSRRLRSITNFFLANLALADFCVGLFCVMQNLSIYLIDSWVFGEFLCRMYQFVHSLSYTASIFILVVICMERYFAIVHPITCKQILTATRLRLAILTVWVTSAVYSTPKFVFSKTIKNIHTEDGQEEEICVLDRKMFNSKLLDMINFGLLYVIPLLVMTVLYSKIAVALWRSSHGLSHHLVTQHQQEEQQQQQQQQQQHQKQQPDESISLHNSMYHHQHSQHHNHNHHHHHHHHHHQQLQHSHQMPYNHHTAQTATTLHNINHHHNHLQQTHAEQHLPGAELTHTTVVGVVGMDNLSGCGAGGAGGSVGGVGGVGGGGGGVVVTNMTSGLLSRKQSSKYEKRGVSITESQVSLDSERPIVSACRNGSNTNGNGSSGGISGGSMNSTHKSSFMQHHHHTSAHPHPHQRARVAHMSHSSNNVLRARRGVVRMLIIFVLTFALCNLPYHARKMWQYWSRSYRGDSNFNALLTPLTFLVTYFNSGINPLLYAFLSRNFRKGMKELLLCSWKKGKGKSSSNSSMHHKRVALQTHSLPTDTTHIGNEQL